MGDDKEYPKISKTVRELFQTLEAGGVNVTKIELKRTGDLFQPADKGMKDVGIEAKVTIDLVL